MLAERVRAHAAREALAADGQRVFIHRQFGLGRAITDFHLGNIERIEPEDIGIRVGRLRVDTRRNRDY